MALPVTCDECFTAFEAPGKAAGKRVRCPTCGAAVRVRAGGGAAPPPVPAAGSRRSRPAPAKSGPSTGVLVGAGLAALLVVGGGALAIGLALGGGGDADVPVAATKPAAADPPAEVPPPRPAVTAVADADEPEEDEPEKEERERLTGGRLGGRTLGGGLADGGGGLGDGEAEADRGPAAGLTEADGTADDAPAVAADDGVRTSKSTGQKTAANEGGLAPVRSETLRGSELVRAVMPSVVRVNNVGADSAGTGSGWVVHPDGIVVTNYHVVAGAARLDVEFEDGTKADSPGYLLVEPKYDIAVIQIDVPDGKTLTPVPIARDLPDQGAGVMAFGTPRGLNFTTTTGSVSGIRDEQAMENATGRDLSGTWVQTDASVSSGNSGGPLCDERGNVVAMNTLASSNSGRGGVSQNINFSISCVSILDRLKTVLGGDAEVKEWDAESLKEYEGRLDRKLVENELGTNKGKRLLAGMTEVLILPYGYSNDPQSGAVWRVVRNFADNTMQRADLDIIWEKPDRVDFAVLLIKMDLEQARRGSNVQRLDLTAELVLPDLEDDSKQNLFCRVWQLERSVGKLSIQALATGRAPRGMQRPMTQFFDTLYRTLRDARKEYDAGELDRDDRLDGGRLAASGEEGLFEEYFGDVFKDDGDEEGPGERR